MVKEFAEAHKFPQIALANDRRKFSRRSNKKNKETEDDEHRLAQRAKQVQYGENTPGYKNFTKALELYPELFKGCIPIKPTVTQKCSKRSWDGQVRKWRRALHMYDFVDFEDDEQASKFIREQLIQQNKNPIFSRKSVIKAAADGDDLQELPGVGQAGMFSGVESPADVKRVKYSIEHLLQCADSPQVAASIQLPETLQWLDKRIDLEDDIGDDDFEDLGSPAQTAWSPFTPGYYSESSPITPFKSGSKSSSASPSNAKGRLQLFPDSPESMQVDHKLKALQSMSKMAQTDTAGGLHQFISTEVLHWGQAPDLTIQDILSMHNTPAQFALPVVQFACSPMYNPLVELEAGLQRLCV